MKFKKYLLMSALLLSSGAYSYYSSRSFEKIGEQANYVLNRELSSSIIREANVDTEIVAYDHEATSYTVHAMCEFKVRFAGTLGGEVDMTLPESLFNGSLLERLRQDRVIKTEKFTVTHQGYEDISSTHGAYQDADKILVTDIDTEGQDNNGCFQRAVLSMAQELTQESGLAFEDVQDLKVQGWYVEEVPVGGIARVVVSGKVRGIAFQAGLDYKAE